MDEARYERLKAISEILARVAVMNEQAAERHKEWEKQAAIRERRMDRFERYLGRLEAACRRKPPQK